MKLYSTIFLVSIMAFNFTPEEFARFHAYIQQGGSLTPSAPNLHPPQAAFQPTQVSSSGPPATQPFPLQQTQVQSQPSVIQPVFQPTQPEVPSTGPPPTQPFLLQQPETQVQSQPSMIQPPPVSQLYRSIRPHQLGHPAATTSCPGTSFNPFFGGAALSLPTAHANQARLASALSSIPRNPSLPRRGRRGPAQHPPALPSSRKVSINNCLSQDASGSHSLRIIVKVIPPPVSNSSPSIIGYSDLLLFFKHETRFQYQLYPELRDSVNMFLQQYHLFYQYNLSLDTSVLMLLDNVSQSMQGSPMQYTFRRVVPSAFIAAHEATPLMLLSLVAQGIPRASDGVIRLRGMPVSPSLTLGSIAAERTTYASPLCIEDDSLVLHIGLLFFFMLQ